MFTSETQGLLRSTLKVGFTDSFPNAPDLWTEKCGNREPIQRKDGQIFSQHSSWLTEPPFRRIIQLTLRQMFKQVCCTEPSRALLVDLATWDHSRVPSIQTSEKYSSVLFRHGDHIHPRSCQAVRRPGLMSLFHLADSAYGQTAMPRKSYALPFRGVLTKVGGRSQIPGALHQVDWFQAATPGEIAKPWFLPNYERRVKHKASGSPAFAEKKRTGNTWCLASSQDSHHLIVFWIRPCG